MLYDGFFSFAVVRQQYQDIQYKSIYNMIAIRANRQERKQGYFNDTNVEDIFHILIKEIGSNGVLDGGLKSILYVYEDHVVISHRDVMRMGLKGDKTIYYSDITSVQYKEPGFFAGYIQFSIPGGNESKGGVFDATKDENTVLLTNKPNIIQEAKEIVDYLNKKIREAKTGAHTAQTVVQQASAADELKKFKEGVCG